jgi:MFS superfamily sulfate permease-like transporter
MKEKLPLEFGRNEFAGAFGDLGTDVPLIVLLILTCRLDASTVLILFGACQVFAGFAYRLPIPVQPLKAMAAIAIADGLGGGVLAGGGLAIGIIMLALSLSGLLQLIDRIIPKRVIRGLQFGLGIKLALTVALEKLIFARGDDGALLQDTGGFLLAGAAFLIVILLKDNRKYPAALVVLAMGLAYTFAFADGYSAVQSGIAFTPPRLRPPSFDDVLAGLLLLAVPQLPLSLGNAVLATRQTVSDLFPGRTVSVRKLGLTYAACNLVAPLFGGVPVCHGSGGLAGHFAFGARTGGSVIIYGGTLLACGLLFGQGFFTLMTIFPSSILGVLLLFEAVTLMRLSRDMAGNPEDFFVVLIVGLLAAGMPYGFCVAMIAGTLLHFWMVWTANGRGLSAVACAGSAGDSESSPHAEESDNG